MTAVSKRCVQTNLRALTIHSEASKALPCCFIHPWPVEGAITPCLLTTDGAQGRSLSCCGTNVNEVWRCLWEARPGLEQRETVLEQQCFWCSYTYSGALLLHLIYCEGPTPSSAWCCHLRAERSVSFCRHLATTEPANQSGRPVVAALFLGSRTGSF